MAQPAPHAGLVHAQRADAREGARDRFVDHGEGPVDVADVDVDEGRGDADEGEVVRRGVEEVYADLAQVDEAVQVPVVRGAVAHEMDLSGELRRR